ncbi:Histidine kinase [Flavobacterium longum]|uniref:ligand-binding sensor domain-containing protein n=1 Tax=Flavobacterium longum TaxID=1299340 RepID=UPI0039E85CC2
MTNRQFSYHRAFALLAVLILGISCNAPRNNNLTKAEKLPKLTKTIGNPDYGNVQCILQDKIGNLWFGTTENGLYRYDGKSFTQFLMANGLNSNSILSILEDKAGKIWIGTEAGLCLYDGKKFTEIQIPLPKNLPPNGNDYYRSANHIFSIMESRTGKLWFATINGVYIYDGKSFTPFTIDKNAGGFLNTNHNVERMLEDNAGNIWFGCRANPGVYRYDGESVTNLKLQVLFQDGPKPKAHDWAWPQLQDKNGHIWFSNWGGAYRYDGNTFTTFTKKDGLKGGVTKIIEDRNGNLWFGGDASAGLGRYDGTSVVQFTTRDGLINDSIWSILEDKDGNIWIGTRATGLSLFDGGRFFTYSQYQR